MRARQLIESIVNIHIHGGQPVVHAGGAGVAQSQPAIEQDDAAEAAAIETVKQAVGAKAYSFKVKRNADGQIDEIVATKI